MPLDEHFDLTATEEAYLEQRVNDQLSWLSKASRRNQNRFKQLKTLSVLLALLIPFLSGLIGGCEPAPYSFWLIGLLGLVIAAAEALLTLNKYHENWLSYRTTAELLKREKMLFITRSASYGNPSTRLQQFSLRVEDILSADVNKWRENRQEAVEELKKESNNQ